LSRPDIVAENGSDGFPGVLLGCVAAPPKEKLSRPPGESVTVASVRLQKNKVQQAHNTTQATHDGARPHNHTLISATLIRS
jgi:hypothetical protein